MPQAPTLSPQITHEIGAIARTAVATGTQRFSVEILLSDDRIHGDGAVAPEWERQLEALCDTCPRQDVVTQFVRELRTTDPDVHIQHRDPNGAKISGSEMPEGGP